MRPLALAAMLLFTLPVARPAAAHEFLVDQRNEPTPSLHHSIRYYMPMGQEFVPTLGRLDVVELDVVDLSGAPSELQVRIRRDAPDGEILGESAVVPVAPWQEGTTHFDFPVPLAVAAGQRHVLEVVHVSGPGNPMLGSGDDAAYADGRAFLSGGFTIANDFWFRTGLDRALPVLPGTWGGLKGLYR
jgi:hypothetical protein